MPSTDNIKIYNDTVLRHTILQGQEAERTDPGTFAMGELAFTRDTGRVFVGTYTENSQSNDYPFYKGGLIVGNKFHGIAEKDKDGKFGKIEYVARHITETSSNEGECITTDTNFYEGDMVFDASDKSLVIFNLNEQENPNHITIKPYEVQDTLCILTSKQNIGGNYWELSLNESKLTEFISNKLKVGFDELSIKSHCSLPKNITYDKTNISLTLDNVEEKKEYITTITKKGDDIEFSPTSYEDFFKSANVTVRPDEESPGIKVRKSNSDDEGGKGTVYKIGLDPEQGLLQDLQIAKTNILDINTYLEKLKVLIPTIEENNSIANQKLNILQDDFKKKGLYHLNDLTEVRYVNTLATITKDNFPSGEVTEEIYSLINSVILQVEIITTDLPVEEIVLKNVKNDQPLNVLQSYPRNSGKFITTVELPYMIGEDNKKQFQLSCNQPDYAPIKVLGYRI